MKLTKLQTEVLLIVANNETHDGRNPIGHSIYSQHLFSKSQASSIPSCVKAGFLISFEDGKDSTLALTQAGADALGANGYTFNENSRSFERTPLSSHVDADERAANAALIAAAPDPLAALVECVDRLAIDYPADNQRITQARAAIAKATQP